MRFLLRFIKKWDYVIIQKRMFAYYYLRRQTLLTNLPSVSVFTAKSCENLVEGQAFLSDLGAEGVVLLGTMTEAVCRLR